MPTPWRIETILAGLARNVRIALMLGALAPAWSVAATLDRSDASGGTIALSGDISAGDADRLAALVERMRDQGQPATAVRLDSPGGSLLEAFGLATVVRRTRLPTIVPGGATCASACFMVLAAGVEKFVSYAAFVGVHGASDESGRETMGSGAATVSMARTLKELGIPEAIIGKMVVTPADDVVWLSVDDLRSMRVRLIDRPVQAPRGGPRQPTPLQLERSAGDRSRLAPPDGPSALATMAFAAAARKDYAAALRIWMRLAERGDAASQYNVAQLYYSGLGIAPNPTAAAGWYRRAAEQGLPDAQLNLGIACALGRGVPENLIEAYEWLDLAANSFATEEQRERAVRARELIAPRMLPEQVASARRLARERRRDAGGDDRQSAVVGSGGDFALIKQLP